MPISQGFFGNGDAQNVGDAHITVIPGRTGKTPYRDLGRSDKRFRQRQTKQRHWQRGCYKVLSFHSLMYLRTNNMAYLSSDLTFSK